MGQSTDGLLFYGFLIPGGEDGEPAFWESEDDPDAEHDKFIAAKLGVVEPDVPYEGNNEAFSAYWTKQREVLKTIPVTVVSHCSGDYPMYAIAISSTSHSASRGYPEEIPAEKLKIDPIWDQQLADFCKLVGIEMGKPSWILASYWG